MEFRRHNFLILLEKSFFLFTDESNIDVLMEIEAISLVAGNISDYNGVGHWNRVSICVVKVWKRVMKITY